MSAPTKKLIYQGSVKNIWSHSLDDKSYIFEYSDRYSIFDWGEMPDLLPNKGASLAITANYFFEKLSDKNIWKSFNFKGSKYDSDALTLLQQNGLLHHSLGLVDENLNRVGPTTPTNLLAVRKINVLHPPFRTDGRYDYSAYREQVTNTLVPLEVIFRFGVPLGSSLLQRAQDNNYLREIGLEQTPQPGDLFPHPVIEFSTKLESTDRYVSYHEAKLIAGLTDTEFKRLHDLTSILALKIKRLFSDLSLELWDGKFEFAFSESVNESRFFQLVDSIGPDELRIMGRKKQLSKEFFRQYYQNSEWFFAIKEAKKLAASQMATNWKDICIQQLKKSPLPLDEVTKKQGASIYSTLTNCFTFDLYQKSVFSDALELDELLKLLESSK